MENRNDRNIELIKNKDYDTLLKENENIIHYVLHKLPISKNEYEDYFQWGSIHLYKAALHYNIESDTAFSTYAIVSIKQSLSLRLTKQYQKNKRLDIISYDQVSSKNDEKIDLLQLIDDNKRIETPILKEELHTIIDEILQKSLKPKALLIVNMYLKEGKNQTEIANYLNCSRQLVNNTIKRAYENLKSKLKEKDIDIYYFE